MGCAYHAQHNEKKQNLLRPPLVTGMPDSTKRVSNVCLVVDYQDDDPSGMTQLLGFEPTAVTAFGWSSLPAQRNWIYDFHDPEAARLEEELSAMVRFLETRTDEIRSVASRYPMWIQIYIDDRDWIWPYEPNGSRSGEFELPLELIRFVSQLGLGFKVHFVCGLKDEQQGMQK
jgi:hypothetical protein